MPTTIKNPSVGLQRQFILAGLILLLITLSLFASTFISTLLISAVIVTGVYPVHKLLHKSIKFSSNLSAFISLILVSLIILVPLTFLFFVIADEATQAYLLVSEKFNTYQLGEIQPSPLLQIEWVKNLLSKINEFLPITTADLGKAGADFIGKISSTLIGQTTNILKNLTVFVIHLVVFLLSMFYFLKDGDRLVQYINSLLPLPDDHKKALKKKLHQLSYGMIYGIFGTAIVQGLLMSVGFSIIGLNNAIFWGAIAGLLSPLPYIGTAAISIPILISLLITQQWAFFLFLFIWSLIIVGGSDNIIKPYIIGSSTALHPLAVLVVLLGGAFGFGLKGLIFGPFVLTLTLAFLHIYSLEYQSDLN